MPRRRFAVALMIPPPVAIEIDGLRRALGDRQLGKIDPHVTVVPPINLHDEQVADALTVVATAAKGRGPMTLELGPVTSFGPRSPVRFLAVSPVEAVRALHEACWSGVLERPRTQDFHPHVTVDIDGRPTDGSPDPAEALLARYSVEVVIDRVTVLEHDDRPATRGWYPYIAYRF